MSQADQENQPVNHADVARMWQEHSTRPFPADGNYEFGDIELHEIDTFSAGCILTFVKSRQLTSEQRTVLKKCQSDLDEVLPNLVGQSRNYFKKLNELMKAVLNLTHSR